jgi:hypothetical protein
MASSPTSSPTSTFTSTAANQQSSGLSIGAKAGIGVAIPVILLAIIGLAIFLRRKKKAASRARQPVPVNGTIEPKSPYSDLMVQYSEGAHDTTKPELHDTSIAAVAPSPTYAHDHPPNIYAHELPASEPPQATHPYEPSIPSHNVNTTTEQRMPADVGPAIVVPTPYNEVPTLHAKNHNQLEQLRLQKAAVSRDRERKEEIDRMRAEEERLAKAIAELETGRY